MVNENDALFDSLQLTNSLSTYLHPFGPRNQKTCPGPGLSFYRPPDGQKKVLIFFFLFLVILPLSYLTNQHSSM